MTTETSVQLVVAADGGGVLNTREPLPTGGLPEWWRCEGCGVRSWHTTSRSDVPFIHRCHVIYPVVGDVHPVGPFPVTVGRWEEAKWMVHSDDPRGAIVQTGVVTAVSHHSAACVKPAIEGVRWATRCHPDAAPGMYHTPVEWADTAVAPMPCDRPPAWRPASHQETDYLPRPASISAVWWVPTKGTTA